MDLPSFQSVIYFLSHGNAETDFEIDTEVLIVYRHCVQVTDDQIIVKKDDPTVKI